MSDFTFSKSLLFLTTKLSHCCHVDGLVNLMSYTPLLYYCNCSSRLTLSWQMKHSYRATDNNITSRWSRGVQYVLVTSRWMEFSHRLESLFFQSHEKCCPGVRQAALRLSGIRLMRELLAWASSVMDTLPLCLMNWATESNSSGVMEINFPRSSITPAGNTQRIISEDTMMDTSMVWCRL